MYNLRSDRPRINYNITRAETGSLQLVQAAEHRGRSIHSCILLKSLETEGTSEDTLRWAMLISTTSEVKQYTIAEVITATSSSNARRQALGSTQAQERSGSSSTKKYWLTRRH